MTDISSLKSLSSYLTGTGRLLPGEHITSSEPAGSGNMNTVIRVITTQRSFILKQSLPWVRKYPSVAAPVGRISTEEQFYDIVRGNEMIRSYTPEIYWFDPDEHLLCLEDLGRSTDFTFIYKKGAVLEKKHMADIARVVSELHFCFKDDNRARACNNHEMRKLNHQHIFMLPLAKDNGFGLDEVVPGLQEASEEFRRDARLIAVAREIGNIYLHQQGDRLLHGDYYPGSWLRTDNGFRMIDPEFCFYGPAEFELAVTAAHLKLARQKDTLIKDLFVYYHFDSRFDGSLFTKFTGMEIIRRLIGLAQLPLDMTLKERSDLLAQAREFVING